MRASVVLPKKVSLLHRQACPALLCCTCSHLPHYQLSLSLHAATAAAAAAAASPNAGADGKKRKRSGKQRRRAKAAEEGRRGRQAQRQAQLELERRTGSSGMFAVLNGLIGDGSQAQAVKRANLDEHRGGGSSHLCGSSGAASSSGATKPAAKVGRNESGAEFCIILGLRWLTSCWIVVHLECRRRKTVEPCPSRWMTWRCFDRKCRG